MEIIIVSDIHLNLRNKNTYEYNFEVNRFLKLFEYVNNLKPDMVILAGDILDNARPTLEEQYILKQGLDFLDCEVYIIDGNHERISDSIYTYDLLTFSGDDNIMYMSNSSIMLNKYSTQLHFKGHKEITNTNIAHINTNRRIKNHILFTHARCTIPPHIKEEINFNKLRKKYSLVLVGDIHQPLDLYDNVKYIDSPYSIHYSKNRNYHIGKLTIDSSGYKFERIVTNLPNKVKVNIEDITLKQLEDDGNLYKVVVTGESSTLSKYKDYKNIKFEKIIDAHYEEFNITAVDTIDVKGKLLDLVSSYDGTTDYLYNFMQKYINLNYKGN
jgi:DNA repair exonuclease SbcCD nuclease subunit